MWRRLNLDIARVGPILAKQKLESFQNPKDARRLVQNIGIDCSHTAGECRFLLQFFRSNNSETNFSKDIKNIKNWQTESRCSIPLHLGFMELGLYFLTRILFSNNVHHEQHRSHTVRSYAKSLYKLATGDLLKRGFQIQVLPENHEIFVNVNKPTGNGRIVNYNLHMSVQFVHTICVVACASGRSDPLCHNAIVAKQSSFGKKA